MPLKRIRIGTTAVLITAMVALSGCQTNPHATWNADEIQAKQLPSYKDFDYAIEYAKTVRRSYRKMVTDESVQHISAGNAFIGLGTIATAIAAFDGGKDALIGTALAGGSGLAFQQWNSGTRRQLIYMAGIRGIDCAIKASTPLYMPPAEQTELRHKLDALSSLPAQIRRTLAIAKAQQNSALQAIASAIAAADALKTAEEAAGITRANSEVDSLPSITDEETQLQSIEAQFQQSIRQQPALLKNGRTLSRNLNIAPMRLVQSIDSITSEIDKAVLESIPDFSAIPKIVGSIATLSQGFSPQLSIHDFGVPKPVQSSITSQSAIESLAGKEKSSSVGPKKPTVREARNTNRQKYRDAVLAKKILSATVNDAAILQDTFAADMALVQSHLDSIDVAAAETQLDECEIESVAPLQLLPETLTLAQGKTQVANVLIVGGTKPYVATTQTGPLNGFDLRNPLPYESNLTITTSDKLEASTIGVLVTDSSRPARHELLTITVGKAGDTANITNSPSAIPKSALDGLDALKEKNLPIGNNVTVTLKNYQSIDDVVKLSFACSPPNTQVPWASVVEKLLEQPGVKDIPGSEKEQNQKLQPAEQQSNSNCNFTHGAIQPQSSIRRLAPPMEPHMGESFAALKSLSIAKIAVLQTNLCVPSTGERNRRIDGIWGMYTHGKLLTWRKKHGNNALSGITAAEIEALLEATHQQVADWCT